MWDSLPPLLHKLMAIGVTFSLTITAITFSFGTGGTNVKENHRYTLADFERIRPGAMKLAEVEAFLSGGTKLEETRNMKKYVWRNSPNSFIIVEIDPDTGLVKRASQEGIQD